MGSSVTVEVQERCLVALDFYARARHRSFLAEFFRTMYGHGFIACFRPLRVSRTPQDRSACEYLYFETEELLAIGDDTELTPDICGKLDLSLSRLPQE
jgi:hypothetical protein